MPKGLVWLLLSSAGWLLLCLLVIGFIRNPVVAAVTMLACLSTGLWIAGKQDSKTETPNSYNSDSGHESR